MKYVLILSLPFMWVGVKLLYKWAGMDEPASWIFSLLTTIFMGSVIGHYQNEARAKS